jgi:CBS domain-containing protein
MVAQGIISDIVTPIKTSDTGESTINHMAVYHVRHLPIVNNEQFLGLISEEEVYDNLLQEPIGSYRLSMVRPFCREDEHIFEIMQKMALYKLTLIPVLDYEDNYLGSIVLEDLLLYYAESYSFKEPGSILVIETSKQDYSLSEIARIAESENVNILASFMTSKPDSSALKVTLKLNSMELSRLAAAYERFDYRVSGRFTEDDFDDALKDRYDAFMRYLDV